LPWICRQRRASARAAESWRRRRRADAGSRHTSALPEPILGERRRISERARVVLVRDRELLREPSRDCGVVRGGVSEGAGLERRRVLTCTSVSAAARRGRCRSRRDRRPPRRTRRFSPRTGSSTGRRCRCSRSLRQAAGPWHGFAERVQVHHHQSRSEPRPAPSCRPDRTTRLGVPGSLRGSWMERLHPAAEHLGSASKILDLRHLDAFAAEQLRGASSGEQLDPQGGEAAGELDDAGLVGTESRARATGMRGSYHGSGPWRGAPAGASHHRTAAMDRDAHAALARACRSVPGVRKSAACDGARAAIDDPAALRAALAN